jgi:hypothetical protein
MYLETKKPKPCIITPDLFEVKIEGIHDLYCAAIHPLYWEWGWKKPHCYKWDGKVYADFRARDGDGVILPSIEFRDYKHLVGWSLSTFGSAGEHWFADVLAWWRLQGITFS